MAFFVAKVVLERFFSDEVTEGTKGTQGTPWLFPQLLNFARRWMCEYVKCKDNAFPQLLRLHERAYDAAERIYRAIVRGNPGEAVLKPILQPYDTFGSTRYVDFNTTKWTYKTRADKCHVSHVVIDSGWEAKMAQTLEDMSEVLRYVKNQNLGFKVPYTLNGEEHSYIPDFILVMEGTEGTEGTQGDLNLLIEVTGEKKKDKAEKVATAKTLWIPAVNNHGGLGKWAFVEVDDPWDCKRAILKVLKGTEGT